MATSAHSSPIRRRRSANSVHTLHPQHQRTRARQCSSGPRRPFDAVDGFSDKTLPKAVPRREGAAHTPSLPTRIPHLSHSFQSPENHQTLQHAAPNIPPTTLTHTIHRAPRNTAPATLHPRSPGSQQPRPTRKHSHLPPLSNNTHRRRPSRALATLAASDASSTGSCSRPAHPIQQQSRLPRADCTCRPVRDARPPVFMPTVANPRS